MVAVARDRRSAVVVGAHAAVEERVEASGYVGGGLAGRGGYGFCGVFGAQ